MTVRELMAQPVVVVPEDTTLEQVARILLDRRIGCVPVVNERGQLSGIVTESDFAAKPRGLPFSPFSMYCPRSCSGNGCRARGWNRFTSRPGRCPPGTS